MENQDISNSQVGTSYNRVPPPASYAAANQPSMVAPSSVSTFINTDARTDTPPSSSTRSLGNTISSYFANRMGPPSSVPAATKSFASYINPASLIVDAASNVVSGISSYAASVHRDNTQLEIYNRDMAAAKSVGLISPSQIAGGYGVAPQGRYVNKAFTNGPSAYS